MTQHAIFKPINWNGEPLSEPIYDELEEKGFVVFDGILPAEETAEAKSKLISIEAQIQQTVGSTRVDPTLRLINQYDTYFNKLLEYTPLLNLVDRFLGTHAIVRFIQGLIFRAENDSLGSGDLRDNLEFHQNFPHFKAEKHLTLEFLFELTDCDSSASRFILVPGSHRWNDRPSIARLEESGQEITIPTGGMLAMFGSTWHREMKNLSETTAYYVTLQISNPFIRPHFDFYRALGEARFAELPARSQILLGLETRLPSSLEEFYS